MITLDVDVWTNDTLDTIRIHLPIMPRVGEGVMFSEDKFKGQYLVEGIIHDAAGDPPKLICVGPA